MKRVFSDAFFYIAVLNRHDAAHARAMEIVARGVDEIVTTAAVLLEVADAMSAPIWRGVCAEFLEDIAGQNGVDIHPLSEDLWKRGFDLYRSRADKEWSLTDCISFVVMADEKLTNALTGDRHFEQAGFKAMLA